MATNFEILSFCFVSLNISFSLCVNSVGPAKTLTRLKDWTFSNCESRFFSVCVVVLVCQWKGGEGEGGPPTSELTFHSLREIRSGFSVKIYVIKSG